MENTSNGGAPDSASTASPDGPKEAEKVYSQSEFESVRKARDEFKAELKAIREQSETEKRNKERDEATKKGDVESIRQIFEKQLAEAKAEVEAKDKELYTVFCEREVRNILKDVTTDDNLAWMLLKDNFELDDQRRPRVKDSILPIRDFAIQELERRGKDHSQERSTTGV